MLLAATTLLVSAPLRAQAPAAPAFDPIVESRKVIDALGAARFAEIEARYGPEMAQALPAGQLAIAWGQLVTQVGALKELGEPRLEEQNGIRIVTFPATYDGAHLTLLVGWNSDHKLVALLARPAG